MFKKIIFAFICILYVSGSVRAFAGRKYLIFGWVEPIKIFPYRITMLAKLDSGAKTASIDAQIIKYYFFQGKRYVRFQFVYGPNKKTLVVEKPVIKFVKIRRRANEKCPNNTYPAERPVVLFRLCMGNQSHLIQVNLIRRHGFKYRFLLGRDAMNQFSALIDPSRVKTKNAICRYVF